MYFGHIDIVKFLFEEVKVHVMLALEVKKSKYEVENDYAITVPRLDAFYFSVSNEDLAMFSYLWGAIAPYITSTVLL